ncbi:MAG: LamG domain-containing protein [Cyanobacteria bacterium P01_E01_bin.42]
MVEPEMRLQLFLDGRDDYVTLPVNSFPTGSEITVSFWSYGGGTLPANVSILAAAIANGKRIFNIHLPWSDGKIYFDCGGSENGYDRIQRQAEPVDYKEKWCHWAFIKNAITGNMKIYHNGELWCEGDGKTFMLSKAAGIRIGSNVEGDFRPSWLYQGSIAELRIWEIARAEEEIKRDMNRHLSGDEKGLVSYWPLDEREGNLVYDKTKHCEPATIHGNAVWMEFEAPPLQRDREPDPPPQNKEVAPQDLLKTVLYLAIGGASLAVDKVNETLENFQEDSKEAIEEIIERGQEVYKKWYK